MPKVRLSHGFVKLQKLPVTSEAMTMSDFCKSPLNLTRLSHKKDTTAHQNQQTLQVTEYPYIIQTSKVQSVATKRTWLLKLGSNLAAHLISPCLKAAQDKKTDWLQSATDLSETGRDAEHELERHQDLAKRHELRDTQLAICICTKGFENSRACF